MTTLGGDASFRDYRNAIDGQIEAGLTLEQVEDFIRVNGRLAAGPVDHRIDVLAVHRL